jgi:hypothetical protein
MKLRWAVRVDGNDGRPLATQREHRSRYKVDVIIRSDQYERL